MRFGAALFSILLLAAGPVRAQSGFPSASGSDRDEELIRQDLALSPLLNGPRMSSELALATYEKRYSRQVGTLLAYTASMVIQAELPATGQEAQFEVRRQYIAPRTLRFTPIRFSGDRWVKSQVIARVLQSEVEHVERQDGWQTAITPGNYKFRYKGLEYLDGEPVHAYSVKPRRKRPGLFKGDIYLDVATGSLCRAKGSVVKSPSFFVRKIEFVQDYADLDGFTFPVHMRFQISARIVGKVVVDVSTHHYAPTATEQAALISDGK